MYLLQSYTPKYELCVQRKFFFATVRYVSFQNIEVGKERPEYVFCVKEAAASISNLNKHFRD